MMAIGGAIGVGLFLGSSVTIRLAGPAVILSYLLGAGIALIMSYALAEMAVVHPVAGAFGVYAEKYLNPWAGFSVRATYGVAQIIAIGAEVTAAGIYISFWFPNVPQWIWVVLVSAALVALNSMQVNRLGEFEYWFAMIKVAAIVAFIIVGIIFDFWRRLSERNRLGQSNSARRISSLRDGKESGFRSPSRSPVIWEWKLSRSRREKPSIRKSPSRMPCGTLSGGSFCFMCWRLRLW